MKADGSVEIVWAGDERTFRLGIDELLALQEKRDAGPLEILRRLLEGTWRLQDITETIRISLIGAGVEAKLAKSLLDEHVRPGRITGSAIVAREILFQALHGDPADPVGKLAAMTEAPEADHPASPPSPSTATAP